MKNEDKSKSSLLAEIESLNARLRSLESQLLEMNSQDKAAESQLFRAIAETAPLGISIAQGTRLVYVNSSLAGLIGLEPAEVIGREFGELVHPDDREMVRERSQARQQGINVPNSYDIRFFNVAGETRWINYAGVAIRYQGEPAVLGFVHDITERKEVERLLETSEKKYRTLIESAGEAIFSVDRNGIFLFMNTEAARQLGGHPDDFVGKSQWEVFPKWLADRQMIQVRKVFETGQGFAREVTTAMQGKEHIHHTTGVPVRNVEGEITSVLGIARDITDLYEARGRLQRSEENYRRFIENLPVGVFQSTPEGKVLSGNPALAHQYGYASVEEYLATPAEDTWADPEQRREWVKLVEQNGTVNDYEVRLKRKDGVYIWVSVSAHGVFDDNHKLLLIDGVEVDLTARRKAEEALRRNGESMRALLNAPSQIMLMVDAKGTILALNDAAAKETGLSIEVALGTCAFEHMTDATASMRKKHFEEVCRTGQPVQFDEYLGERSFETTLYPVFGDDRQVEAIVASSIDVSEARRALDDLRESEELFRAVAESAPVSIAINQGNKMVYANRIALDTVGYYAHDVGSQNSWDLVHPDYRQMVREVGRARQNGDPVPPTYEVKVVGRGGEERWVLVSGSRIQYRRAPASLVIAVDITERKQTEETLRLLTHRLSIATESAGIGVWDLDLKKNHLVWDNRMYQMYGVSESDFGGAYETWQRSVHPDDLERASREVSEAVSSKEDFHTSFRIVVSDGHVRHIEAHALVLCTPDGKPDRMIGVNLDVTERKQAEEALLASESFSRAVVENSPVGISIRNAKSELLSVNDALMKIWGISPEDVEQFINEGSQDLADTEKLRVLAQWVPQIESIYRKGGVLRIPEVHYSDDASARPRWVSFTYYAVVNDQGEVDRVVILTEDITERKHLEDQLRESGERFRRITERSFDAIYHIDVDGMLTYASPAAERIAGYRPDEVIGRHVSEFISKKHLPAVGRALAVTATGQSIEGLQFEIIAADGHIVYVEANATPIIHNNRVVAAQALVRDISARRHAEQMLEQAYEEQSRQLRQVAGGLAHDIYNDLYPASVAIHKLRQRLEHPDNPERERNLKLLQLMEKAILRAIDLTEAVSLYAKLQRNTTSALTRIRKVIDQVLEHHKRRLDQLEVKTLVEVPDVLQVACSERNLHTLMTNLLLNALDAMAASKQPSLSVTARLIDGKVEVSFSDNGSGIAPDVLPRVFEPFFSTKPSTGTGLGLAIVKRVVDLYGGTIKVDSSVDIGTTFHILLPGDVGT